MNMQGKTVDRSSATTQATLLGLSPSFGFGDRLGCATPGHLAALKAGGGEIKGIFAQQSIREMSRTHRTPDQVMAAAVNALEAADYAEPWGADADHLKTPADVDYTLAAGFTFFTIDPSDHVDRHAGSDDPATLEKKYQQVAGETTWVQAYKGKTVRLPGDLTITFDDLTLKRAAVKYGRAIAQGIKLGRYIQEQAGKVGDLRAATVRERLDADAGPRSLTVSARSDTGRACEIELSVDETDEPTTPAEHYLIADQFRKNGVKLISLAPRFVGELEKGVDYIGDLKALERSLKEHAAIAKELGPYKLSLHSGSDKISMYSLLARAAQGLFHVKTAGTSYLEALRVVARHDAAAFRRIIDFSRSRYDKDRATYHVHAAVDREPAPAEVADNVRLEQIYLERWEDVPQGKGFTAAGRQILHCTFGSVLTDATLGPLVHQMLREHADTYRQVLKEHFVRHLEVLR